MQVVDKHRSQQAVDAEQVPATTLKPTAEPLEGDEPREEGEDGTKRARIGNEAPVGTAGTLPCHPEKIGNDNIDAPGLQGHKGRLRRGRTGRAAPCDAWCRRP